MKTQILGLDIGVTSIGWAVVQYDQNDQSEITASGVRIFDQVVHNKSKATLASIRRQARSARRSTKRKASRMYKIKSELIKAGLVDISPNLSAKQQQSKLESIFRPQGKTLTDVWELRQLALEQSLSAEDWFRVLIHIAKHRGYKSNSLDEAAYNQNDSEETKKDITQNKAVIRSIEKNKKLMEEKSYRTVGEMVFKESETTKQKISDAKDAPEVLNVRRNKKGSYIYSVLREMNAAEVDILFEKQASFGNPHAKDAIKEIYKDTAFHQRPIKSIERMVGQCTFEKDEKRAAKNSLSAEKFVVISKIVNLKVYHLGGKAKGDMPLYELIAQRDGIDSSRAIEKIFQVFKEAESVNFKSLRKHTNLSEDYQFTDVLYHFDSEKDATIPSDPDKFFKTEDWLSTAQKDMVLDRFENPKERNKGNSRLNRVSYQFVRNVLALPTEKSFNGHKRIHPEVKAKLPSMAGYHAIKKSLKKHPDLFAKLTNQQDLYNRIATKLTNLKDDDQIKDSLSQLLEQSSLFTAEQQSVLLDALQSIRFSRHINLSIKAVNKLIPHLQMGLRYDEAVRQIPEYRHRLKAARSCKLRPMNEHENHQITNPQVKRTISQCRKLINAIIKKYGLMDAVHIELVRELKKSKKQLREHESQHELNKQEKKSRCPHI